MDSMHILIVPVPMHGHTTPAVLLARRLSGIGVQPTVVCPQFRIEQLKGSSTRNQGINFAATSSDEAPPLEVGSHDSEALVEWIVCKYLSGEEANLEELRQLVKSMASKPTCIISDVPWALQVAKELGVSSVFFHASTALDLAVAFHAKALFDQGTFPSSKHELVSVPGIPRPIPAIEIYSMSTPVIQQYYREASDLLHQSDAAMSVSFEGLEPDACKAISCNKELNPNGVLFAAVGPLLDDPNVQVKRKVHFVLQWLDAQAPGSVVYMSFGSFAQASKEQMEEIAGGIEASGLPFVWVVHHASILPDHFQERTEGKGMVVRAWAPQLDILSHPAVAAFATHCGWNSIMESIWCGVPMGVLPFYDEQRANARFVVESLRIGEPLCDLSTCVGDVEDPLHREHIASVLQRLMRSNKLRNRAMELREVSRRAAETAPSRLKGFLASLATKKTMPVKNTTAA